MTSGTTFRVRVSLRVKHSSGLRLSTFRVGVKCISENLTWAMYLPPPPRNEQVGFQVKVTA